MAQTTLMTAVAKQTDIPQQALQSALQPAPSQESTAAHVENKEVLAFVAEMEKQNQGFCYHHVQALPEARVDGRVVLHTHVEYVKQMPGDLLGSVYGCGYGFDLDDPGKWFEKIYQRKEQDMRMPFKDFRALTRRKVEHHEEYYFYRLIKAENYRVFIDRLVLDALAGKFDVQAWQEKFAAPAGKAASAQYDTAVQQTMNLLERANQLSRHDGALAQIKATIAAQLGIAGSFWAKPHVCPEYAHLSVELLHQYLCAKRLELKEINRQIQELERSIGMTHFDKVVEWG